MMNFEKLDGIAATLMKERCCHSRRETGSVYFHGKRVARGVISLRELTTQDASHDDILKCAAMFHDVGKGLKPHSVYGAMIVRRALAGELDAAEMEEVCRLIEAHGDRRPALEVHDLWVWLLQDADILDHVGTYEMWMSCNYYAYEKRPFDALLEWYPAEFENTMTNYRARLNLEVSKNIFDSKVEFERTYIERLIVEAGGGYCDSDVR